MNAQVTQGLPELYTITIGRSFGAGGRAVGRLLADRLGIEYYDKELLVQAASRAGMDCGLFEKNDERAPGFLAGVMPMSMGYSPLAWYAGPGAAGSQAVYTAQSDFIRHLADTRPCVIVGRTADYVLRDRPHVLSVFLHAPEDECIRRILRRDDCQCPDKARQLLRKTNRLRAEFYNFYTDRTWGAADTYHLTLDSSALTTQDTVDTIIEFLKKFLDKK